MSRSRLLAFLVVRARRSGFWLGLLNLLMARTIPFNRPHRFRITTIAEERIEIVAPYRKSNFNHIRGIHACAIATAAEFAAGFLLLTNLDPARYRIIMGRLSADYRYQAKSDIFAESTLDRDRLRSEVLTPLEREESVTVEMQTDVRDAAGNDIARVTTVWQVKRWDRVRTRV